MAVFADVKSAPQVLTPEIELAKAAVLYGDEVDLFGLGTALFLDYYSELDLPDAALLARLREQAQNSGDPAKIAKVSTIEHDPRLLTETRLVARADLDKRFAQHGGTELNEAVKAGRLRLHSLTRSSELSSSGDTNHVHALMRQLVETMNSEEPQFPLLTADIASLLHSGISEGAIDISPRSARWAREAGLAAGLFRRIPTFPGADMSEILDIRKALREPLVRFRTEMLELSTSIPAAAHDPDFEVEVDEAWSRRIAPALEEIRSLVGEDSYLRQLGTPRSVGETLAQAIPASASLMVALATGSGMAALAAAGLATAAPLIYHGVRPLVDEGDTERSIANMKFVFLHHVDRQLA